MKEKHRIFIAINFPHEIKKILAKYQEKWPELPAKWTKADNLHVTLAFLGNIDDIEIGEVCLALKEVAKKHNPFELNLNKIEYGPVDKIPPRMLWATGEKSKELSVLKNDISESIAKVVPYSQDHKHFSLHVTLARISSFQWKFINPEERPEIPEEINLPFSVESIEVMESKLRKEGPQYEIIESFILNE